MSKVKLIIAVFLCVSVTFFCACFSLGVEDMSEYVARFPSVYAIYNDFSSNKKGMSDFVGDDDFSPTSDEDKSELVQVVSISDYRAIAIEVDSGDGKYPTSTIGEFALYVYYEGDTEMTLSYGLFVSSSLPEDDKSKYTISDITDSSESDLYTDGSVVSPFSDDDFLVQGSVSVSKGWSNIYSSFDGNITISDGSYLIIVFKENNNYSVAVTQNETTTDDGNGGTVTTYTYTYAFSQYTTDDVSFSFDKTLLYVSE